MTQEENLLLTKDLCARLPYRVKVQHFGITKELLGLIPSTENVMVGYDINDYEDSIIEDIKPYLRPMSSMTEEECDMVEEILGYKCIFDFMSNGDIVLKQGQFSQNKLAKLCDYYASIHVDYRGLIEKGLAIEVTEENNPYE